MCPWALKNDINYVYGIYEYKVLKKIFQSKITWEKNNRQDLGYVDNRQDNNEDKNWQKKPRHYIKRAHQPSFGCFQKGSRWTETS